MLTVQYDMLPDLVSRVITLGLSAGVTGLRVGDTVFGLAPGCFGPSVVLPADLMVPKPPGLSFTQAATLPTVFVTVFAALGKQGLSSADKVRAPQNLGL